MKKIAAAITAGMLVLAPMATATAAPTPTSASASTIKGYPHVKYVSKYAAGRFCSTGKKHTHSPRGVIYCRYVNGSWRWKYTR